MNQPFTSDSTEVEVLVPSAVEAISRAEIDVAIATAQKYPQHTPGKLSLVKQSMMSFATLDEETAAACFYTLPRGGKNIQGPSVRLAEIALACYGNARAGTRIISTVTSGPTPHVVVQAVVMDLEKNTSVSIEKRRRIVGKKSKGGVIDEDDINLAANSCSAIAFRDAVFKVVPGALIKPVFEAARKVAIGDAKTLGDRRAKCVEAFAKLGITKDRVLAKVDKKSVDDIDLSDLETLIGLFNAIKEGDVSIDEMNVSQTSRPADLSDLNVKIKADLKAGVAQPAKAKAPEPKPEPAKQQETTEQSLPTCRYCHAPVLDMSQHTCTAMEQAMAKSEPKKPAAPAEPETNPEPPEPTEEQESAPDEAQGQAPETKTDPLDESKLALDNLYHLLGTHEITPEQCLAFCVANGIATKKHTKLSELATGKLNKIAKAIENSVDIREKMKAA